MQQNLNINIRLFTITLLFCALIFASCSKDPEITHYQLEGTWSLYKTTLGQQDSIYELSEDNQIQFAPRYFWQRTDGILVDSGSYILTDIVNENGQFKANWNVNATPNGYITISGDTLTHVGLGFIANSSIYLRAEPASIDD